MKLFRDIVAGVVASGLFAMLDHYVLSLSSGWRIAGLFVTFCVALGVAIFTDKKTRPLRMMSRNKTSGKLDASIKGGEVEISDQAEIMSNNKSKDDTTLTIENVNIRKE